MVDKLAMMAPAALSVLSDLMDDEETSPKNLLDAEKIILDRAGFVPPKASVAPTVGEKALHQITRVELIICPSIPCQVLAIPPSAPALARHQ